MELITTWEDPTEYKLNSTSFGRYDDLYLFTSDAVKVAKFVSRKLGYPIVNILIIPLQVFNHFLLAIDIYQSFVQKHRLQNLTTNLLGTTDGDITNKTTTVNLKNIFKLSKQYGDYLNIGRDTKLQQTHIDLQAGKQIYDLTDLVLGLLILIVTIHHYPPNFANMLVNPFFNLISNYDRSLSLGFGMNGLNTTVYMMAPIHLLLLAMQAILFNQLVRRSEYGFDLIGNDLRIYPTPKIDRPLFITYKIVKNASISKLNVVSDINDVKINKRTYASINLFGKNWIYRLTVALSKLTLGLIRSKYSSIPIPEGDISVDGDSLRNLAKELIMKLYLLLDLLLLLSNLYKSMLKKRQFVLDSYLIVKKTPFKNTITSY